MESRCTASAAQTRKLCRRVITAAPLQLLMVRGALFANDFEVYLARGPCSLRSRAGGKRKALFATLRGAGSPSAPLVVRSKHNVASATLCACHLALVAKFSICQGHTSAMIPLQTCIN